ncbi:hypothetical protein BB561_003220 [Smittium simulii]|uniref:Uncharacterized protein n=1 Tax=Smittium simulii TaxID=133385 RepID=A0A2T9YMJ0_9FUNG|nr:hypothetical protein BB561_003220 [Smittium simulii]
MPKVPGVIPSAAAEVSLTPAKRTRLEYSTVAKTVKQAIKFMKAPIFINERRVELYQTIKLEEGAQIISTPSAKNLRHWKSYFLEINLNKKITAKKHTFLAKKFKKVTKISDYATKSTVNTDKLFKNHNLAAKINNLFSECKTELLTQKKLEKTAKIITQTQFSASKSIQDNTASAEQHNVDNMPCDIVLELPNYYNLFDSSAPSSPYFKKE